MCDTDQSIARVTHAYTRKPQPVNTLDGAGAASVGGDTGGKVDLFIIRELGNEGLGLLVCRSPVAGTSSLGYSRVSNHNEGETKARLDVREGYTGGDSP